MDGAEARDLYPAVGARARTSMSRRVRRSLQNLGCVPGRSGPLMRKLRKGIRLKFWIRDVAVDGYVRKSGDVGGIPERTPIKSSKRDLEAAIFKARFDKEYLHIVQKERSTRGRTIDRCTSSAVDRHHEMPRQMKINIDRCTQVPSIDVETLDMRHFGSSGLEAQSKLNYENSLTIKRLSSNISCMQQIGIYRYYNLQHLNSGPSSNIISNQVSKVNSLWSMEQCRHGKSAKWIRLGSGVPVPNPSTVGGLVELLTWRERTASCRSEDGLGTALSRSFPGHQTANSELVRTRGIRQFN
ncbi:hypothetical protein YC2023_108474 [Brassica napus]